MKSRSVFAGAAAVFSLALLVSCQTATSTPAASSPDATPGPEAPPVTPAAIPAPEPEHIKLQHILISFAGKVPGKDITRSEAEARALATQLLERARAGEDFDALVKQYTDDRHPGIYGLSNRGVAAAQGEFPRERMVPAFGDVGFTLQPGETGMAPYDPAKSPYGWHIIRRLE